MLFFKKNESYILSNNVYVEWFEEQWYLPFRLAKCIHRSFKFDVYNR
jgi:hypothetical protein